MPDNLTPKQRSYCMSRIKGRDTGLELQVRSALRKQGLKFRKYVKELPGKPDIVFMNERVVVFIDGDFWHGYRFPCWRKKVSAFWQTKISKNRERDTRTHRKLKRKGWKVIRLWQHEIKDNMDKCIARIVAAL